MRVIINTGRTIAQGSYVDRKNCQEYNRETSTIRLSPIDMMNLGCEDGEHVKASGDGVSIVLRAVSDETVDTGHAFLPLGPYANFLVSGATHGTGMPDFKKSIVDIAPTEEEILNVGALMATMGGMAYQG